MWNGPCIFQREAVNDIKISQQSIFNSNKACGLKQFYFVHLKLMITVHGKLLISQYSSGHREFSVTAERMEEQGPETVIGNWR